MKLLFPRPMMVDFLYPRHECIAYVRVKYPEYLAGESFNSLRNQP